jgi:hypothetical protein
VGGEVEERRKKTSGFSLLSSLFSLKKWVKIKEDNVRFYWISADAVSRVLTLGSAPPEPPPNAYIL